jgi:hypothetical protein
MAFGTCGDYLMSGSSHTDMMHDRPATPHNPLAPSESPRPPCHGPSCSGDNSPLQDALPVTIRSATQNDLAAVTVREFYLLDPAFSWLNVSLSTELREYASRLLRPPRVG